MGCCSSLRLPLVLEEARVASGCTGRRGRRLRDPGLLAVKGPPGTYRGHLLRVHFCVGRRLKPVCGCCFPAAVNINEAVGARPSGRPGLPRWEGMEIMLCTLDRALNPASEAAAPELPRKHWHDFCSQDLDAWPGEAQSPQTSEGPLAATFAMPHPTSAGPPVTAHPLHLKNSSLQIYCPQVQLGQL